MEQNGDSRLSIRLEWRWHQSKHSVSADDRLTQAVCGSTESFVPIQVRSAQYSAVRESNHTDLLLPTLDTVVTRYETIHVTVPGFGRLLPQTDLPNAF